MIACKGSRWGQLDSGGGGITQRNVLATYGPRAGFSRLPSIPIQFLVMSGTVIHTIRVLSTSHNTNINLTNRNGEQCQWGGMRVARR